MANTILTALVGAAVGGAAVYFGGPLVGLPAASAPPETASADPMEGMDHSTMSADAGPAAAGYAAAMDTMMAAMPEPTGDADEDYMRGMVPHHQAAIDMSNTLLEHGTDAETRALAEAIIAAQTDEIAQIEAWLAAR